MLCSPLQNLQLPKVHFLPALCKLRHHKQRPAFFTYFSLSLRERESKTFDICTEGETDHTEGVDMPYDLVEFPLLPFPSPFFSLKALFQVKAITLASSGFPYPGQVVVVQTLHVTAIVRPQPLATQ